MASLVSAWFRSPLSRYQSARSGLPAACHSTSARYFSVAELLTMNGALARAMRRKASAASRAPGVLGGGGGGPTEGRWVEKGGGGPQPNPSGQNPPVPAVAVRGQPQIRFAAPRPLEHVPPAFDDDLAAGLLLEIREQLPEQAAALRRDYDGDANDLLRLVLLSRGRGRRQQEWPEQPESRR